jgi:hypothetical protein
MRTQQMEKGITNRICGDDPGVGSNGGGIRVIVKFMRIQPTSFSFFRDSAGPMLVVPPFPER